MFLHNKEPSGDQPSAAEGYNIMKAAFSCTRSFNDEVVVQTGGISSSIAAGKAMVVAWRQKVISKETRIHFNARSGGVLHDLERNEYGGRIANATLQH
jgi:hypothetical protein